MKRKMLPLFAPTLLLLAAVLAGCNKEETDANQLPDGKHPLTLTAAMEGLMATRATPDGSWKGGEEVAIQIGSEVKKYIAATTDGTNGTLTVASGVTPHYWQSTANITVSAWIPYSAAKPTSFAAKPTSFAVKADQSGDGYQNSDMLWSSKEISYGGSSALEFKHLPAKVVVNLKYSETTITDTEVQNTTVTLMSQNLTSGAITVGNNNVWSVAKAALGSDEIKTNTLSTVATGYKKTMQALVAPQQMKDKKFIKVTTGGNDYYYTPTTDAMLESGKQHTYNITVQMKNGITVTTSEITAWTNKGSITDVTSKEFVASYEPSSLKTGDYYYSDGTTSDGGYRKSQDGVFSQESIMPVLTGTSGAPRTVLGIVLKAGKDYIGDWVDDSVYKSKDGNTSIGVRGYVLALYDTEAETWGATGENVGTNTELTGFYGYTNTNTIKAYAEKSGNKLYEKFPVTYHATTGYENKYHAPVNSSGWFFPSAGQCKYWYDNRNVILANIKNATYDNSYTWEEYYFSSSELAGNPADGIYDVDFRPNGAGPQNGGKGSHGRTRSILAF